MSVIEVLTLAAGLSMDALAVAIACGCILKVPKLRQSLKIAAFFSAFQMGMPLAGWLLASSFRQWLESVDHWIAFILLSFIGFKMLSEGLKRTQEKITNPLNTVVLVSLSIATSVDALAAGISFSLLDLMIGFPIAIIGVVTFALSFAGVQAGSRFGHRLENKAKIAGGLILIAFGIKILIEHLAR